MRSMIERAVASAVLAVTVAAGPAIAQVTPTVESRQEQTPKTKVPQAVTIRGETDSEASEQNLKVQDNAPGLPQDRWNWSPRSFEEEKLFPSER